MIEKPFSVNLPETTTQPSTVENSVNFCSTIFSPLPDEHYLQFGANIQNLIG